MTAAVDDRIVYQALHEDVRQTLDPEYVVVHDKHLQFVQPINEIPWDPSNRFRPSSFSGQSSPRPVKSIEDVAVDTYSVRVITPLGERPAGGWPLLVWYHGGGWVMGSAKMDDSFNTQIASGAQCVVMSVEYRLAPEHQFPAAIDDSLAALQWAYNNSATYNVNPSRIAVGGLSAGGGLAASVALAAPTFQPPIPLVFQLLVAPVIDNTANAEPGGLWADKPHAPFLSAARMMWFRELYLLDKKDWTDWKASPNLAEKSMLDDAKSTKAYVIVADHDVLSTEGLLYAKLLKEHGNEVILDVIKGATHSVLLLDAVVRASAEMRVKAVRWVRQKFYPE